MVCSIVNTTLGSGILVIVVVVVVCQYNVRNLVVITICSQNISGGRSSCLTPLLFILLFRLLSRKHAPLLRTCISPSNGFGWIGESTTCCYCFGLTWSRVNLLFSASGSIHDARGLHNPSIVILGLLPLSCVVVCTYLCTRRRHQHRIGTITNSNHWLIKLSI